MSGMNEWQDRENQRMREHQPGQDTASRLWRENQSLRAALENAKGYVDRAIASYVGDPANNDFQRGFQSALEVVRDEAFVAPSVWAQDCSKYPDCKCDDICLDNGGVAVSRPRFDSEAK